MAWSVTDSGNNTASGSWAVSTPAASAGDLLIVHLSWDDSTTTTDATAPAGKNSETAVDIETVKVSASTTNRGKVLYYLCTGTWTAGTITFTPTASEQWTASVIKVPSGEFDPTTPIGAHNAFQSTTTTTSPALPSLTAGSTDGGGTAVGYLATDADNPDGTVTGWTQLSNVDRGAQGEGIYSRDATVTNSENLGTVSGWTLPIARNYVSFIYIVRVVVNDPPTVTLNSPADAGTTTDTTPTLDFTGTDADGDDIRYNIQIDTVNTFDSISGGSAVTDSYAEANAGPSQELSGDTGAEVQGTGQSITGDGGTLASVEFYLNKVDGSPTGNAVAKIYAHSGTFGTSSVATGAALATSATFDVSVLTVTRELVEFIFSGGNQITLANGTKYCAVVEFSGGDSSNSLGVAIDTSSPTHAGNQTYLFGGTWLAAAGADVIFYVNTEALSPLLDKVSGTDSGFANPDNGGDTDPFTSGENIQYTVQAGDALAIDTYYWRVRGKDPSGTNTYGAWSSTRSFDVISAGGGASPVLTLLGIG